MGKVIWKDIPGYEGYYQVSNTGEVKSLARERYVCKGIKCPVKERILKKNKYQNGYLFVILSKNGEVSQKLIHRIVMMTFVGDSKLEVNHKDGNKENNSIENLEYVTHSQNQIHSFRVLKRKPVKSWKGKRGFDHDKSIAVIFENINTQEKTIYGSYRIASEKSGISRYIIRKYIGTGKPFKNIIINKYEGIN